MAPKKAVPVTKEEAPATAETKTKAAKPTKLKNLVHPSTLAMVVEALKKDSERKGTSVQAIRTRILAAHPTVDPVRLKYLLRTALNKGIEKGILVRPPDSNATGATGRFKLAKPLPKTKEGSSASENVDPNGLAKEKTKKKVVKVAKPTESKDEKPEKSETASKKKSSEPKASKPKKETEEKPKGPAPPKKPKAKTAVNGETKTKKEPAKKEKAETAKEKAETKKVDAAEKETTKFKDSEENAAAKSSKKGKK